MPMSRLRWKPIRIRPRRRNSPHFRAAGVNRLSLGVQSLRDEDLQFLGRAHDASEARRAIELARSEFSAFFVRSDLCAAEQTPEAWEQELREACSMADGHLSLYQLTISPIRSFIRAPRAASR